MDAELMIALSHLRRAVGERNFTMWIEPISWSRKGDVIVLEMPSRFHREWVTRHLLRTIEDALKQALGDERKPQVVIGVRCEGEVVAHDEPSRSKPRTQLRMRAAAPLPRVGRLIDGYDFDSFVVGPTNELAAKAARAVAQEPGRRFNPLFVWGGVGLGKTHLVNAIGHESLRASKNKRVACLSAELFTNMMIQALRTDRMAQFRERFRELDVLILDDVQFLAGKERTQEEFFHTFEWLIGAQKQVVLTCDQHPSAVARLESRLRSRFESGLITDVQAPTEEMRLEILRRKLERRGHELPEIVLQAIVSRCGPSVRELEGGLNRVTAYMEMMQQPASVDLVERLLGPVRIEPVRRQISVASIRDAVAEHFGLTASELVGHGREKRVSQARQIAMYLCKSLGRVSLSRIASEFGGRDHTSVLYAIRAAERRCQQDPEWATMVAALERSLLPGQSEQRAMQRS
ncbi:MAG: chromosomal replication initiator protein DnaA [Candidatus Binatia bacterium]|nr:chromosomal replication initiator protein DnaA [Candidatus Binatia bacterium]